jgi:hypothetical protein
VRSCCARVPSSSQHPLSIHTTTQPGASLSPICFASHRALSQLTSPCDSNRARLLHTCCVCLLGSSARQSSSVAAPVTSCCNPTTSCDSCLAHSWMVDVRSGSFAGDFRSCPSTQKRAGCCRCTSPSSFFVWPSMLRLSHDWALPTCADLQSTMSNQRWASPLVLQCLLYSSTAKPAKFGCTLRPARPSAAGSCVRCQEVGRTRRKGDASHSAGC